MFFPRIHYIYRVWDRNGLEDIIETLDPNDIPCKWVRCEPIRSYIE
jgi:hypothetical protein